MERSLPGLPRNSDEFLSPANACLNLPDELEVKKSSRTASAPVLRRPRHAPRAQHGRGAGVREAGCSLQPEAAPAARNFQGETRRSEAHAAHRRPARDRRDRGTAAYDPLVTRRPAPAHQDGAHPRAGLQGADRDRRVGEGRAGRAEQLHGTYVAFLEFVSNLFGTRSPFSTARSPATSSCSSTPADLNRLVSAQGRPGRSDRVEAWSIPARRSADGPPATSSATAG